MSKIARDAACSVHHVSAHQFGHYTLWAGAVTSNGRVIPTIPTPLTSTHTALCRQEHLKLDKYQLVIASASVNQMNKKRVVVVSVFY